MKNLEKILSNIGIEENLYSDFFNILNKKELQKGEILIKEKQICNLIAFVEKGILRSFINSKENNECNNDFYLPNSFATALTSYLTGEKTNCNIQALEKSTIWIIEKKELEKLIKKNIVWEKLLKYISETYFIRKCKRETSFLKDNAFERLESTLKIYPKIEQFVSQKHLASYLGIQPQSLSRIKSSHRLTK